MINYGRHFIDKADLRSVSKVLKSNFLTTGPCVKKFEQKAGKFINSKNFISCSSGTAALDMVFRAIDLGKKDNVIIPSINFIASYNLLKNKEVNIYLADVDPIHGQMTKQTIEKCIKVNKLKKIKALVVMYHGGFTGLIEEYIKLKKKYGFYLIEDGCHAFGAKYKVKKKIFKIGDCKFSDFSTFSFHPIKTITTAEGGAISCKNKKYIDKIKLIRSHGIVRSKNHWQYDVIINGLNYRMSDLNAALGISQLNKVNKFISYRKQIAKYYLKEFKNFSHYINCSFKSLNYNSFHLFFLQINFKKMKVSKNYFMKFLKNKNIFVQYHYIPIYRFSSYKKKNKYLFSGSEFFYRRTISLPIFYGLNKNNLNYIKNNIKKFIILYKK